MVRRRRRTDIDLLRVVDDLNEDQLLLRGESQRGAMQVYAVAIVDNARQVAQNDAAAQQGLPPEDLSPAKLLPKITGSRCVMFGEGVGSWPMSSRIAPVHVHHTS